MNGLDAWLMCYGRCGTFIIREYEPFIGNNHARLNLMKRRRTHPYKKHADTSYTVSTPHQTATTIKTTIIMSNQDQSNREEKREIEERTRDVFLGP